VRLDQLVDLFIAGGCHAKDILGKAARFGIHLFPGGPEGLPHLVRGMFPDIGLEEHLHSKFA
jgi:hypothetical protein